MSDQKNVFKYTDVKMKNIIYSESVKTKSEDFVFSKIWYKCNDNKQVQTLNIQTPYFKIHEMDDDKNSVILLPEKELEMFFDNLDSLTIDFIKTNIVAKHNIKGISYRTIVNEIPNMNVFRAKIGGKQKPPHFYLSKNKNRLSYDEAINMLDRCEKVKLILEIDGLIIDFNKKIMYTNVVVRQMLISEIEPKKIELETHSFIESESDNDQIETELVMNLPDISYALPVEEKLDIHDDVNINKEKNEDEMLPVPNNSQSDTAHDTNESNSITLKESDKASTSEEEKPKLKPKLKRGRPAKPR